MNGDEIRRVEEDEAFEGFRFSDWYRVEQQLREATRKLIAAMDSLKRAGVAPETPPEDPRARALWMKQHRGTGPGKPVQEQRRRRSPHGLR